MPPSKARSGAGYDVIQNGGSALDAVTAAITPLEDAPLFNAGKGAVFTHEGTVELDASIMDGATLEAGAVAGVTTVKNPILLARRVMEASPHVLLTGEGAEMFADEQGFEAVANDYFYTDGRREALERVLERERSTSGDAAPQAWQMTGTVGAVARDRNGHLAAATSTGGMTNKRWGRVGDSPIIGAGTYADDATCAVSATGHGEYFIRLAVAHDIAARMRHGGTALAEAADDVIHGRLADLGGTGGVIAIDSEGHVGDAVQHAGDVPRHDRRRRERDGRDLQRLRRAGETKEREHRGAGPCAQQLPFASSISRPPRLPYSRDISRRYLDASRMAYDLEVAAAHVAASDRVMAKVVERAGPCLLQIGHLDNAFQSLLKSIVYQQLNGKAAGTIYGRVLDLFPGEHPRPGRDPRGVRRDAACLRPLAQQDGRGQGSRRPRARRDGARRRRAGDDEQRRDRRALDDRARGRAVDGRDAADLPARPPGRAARDRLRRAQRLPPRLWPRRTADAEGAEDGGRAVATVPQRGELVPLARGRPGSLLSPGWGTWVAFRERLVSRRHQPTAAPMKPRLARLCLVAFLFSTALAAQPADTLLTWQTYGREGVARVRTFASNDVDRPLTVVVDEQAASPVLVTDDVRFFVETFGRGVGVDPAETKVRVPAFSGASFGAGAGGDKVLLLRATFTRTKTGRLSTPFWRVVTRDELAELTDRALY